MKWLLALVPLLVGICQVSLNMPFAVPVTARANYNKTSNSDKLDSKSLLSKCSISMAG
jgi:hypothetical protein